MRDQLVQLAERAAGELTDLGTKAGWSAVGTLLRDRFGGPDGGVPDSEIDAATAATRDDPASSTELIDHILRWADGDETVLRDIIVSARRQDQQSAVAAGPVTQVRVRGTGNRSTVITTGRDYVRSAPGVVMMVAIGVILVVVIALYLGSRDPSGVSTEGPTGMPADRGSCLPLAAAAATATTARGGKYLYKVEADHRGDHHPMPQQISPGGYVQQAVEVPAGRIVQASAIVGFEGPPGRRHLLHFDLMSADGRTTLGHADAVQDDGNKNKDVIASFVPAATVPTPAVVVLRVTNASESTLGIFVNQRYDQPRSSHYVACIRPGPGRGEEPDDGGRVLAGVLTDE